MFSDIEVTSRIKKDSTYSSVTWNVIEDNPPIPLTEEQCPPTFASTNNKHGYSFFNPQKQLFIKKEQIPEQVLILINELKKLFPDGYFYLTGAAPFDLLYNIQPNDYDILVVNVSLDEIQSALNDKRIYSEQRSKKYPIVHCTLPPEIKIDFSAKFLAWNQTYAWTSCGRKKLLKSDYLRRDFNLNACYLEFTQQDQYDLFSFHTTYRYLKTIHTVSDSPIDSFREDPTRLFRLAKLIINYPNFPLEEGLISALTQLKMHWFTVFNTYLSYDKSRAIRLDQAIRKLFLRYSIKQINKAFCRLKVLPLFSGHNEKDCINYCLTIPQNIPKELNYEAWTIANSLYYLEKTKKLLCPLTKYLIKTPTERNTVSYLYQIIRGEPPRVKINSHLLKLIQLFDLKDVLPSSTYKILE